MIYGVGIDSVEIARFARWHTYPRKSLARIFSPKEISYCLENKEKSLERFAVRFAAREAFFKALAQPHSKPVPFLAICKILTLDRSANGAPHLIVNWQKLHTKTKKFAPTLDVHVSLTHTRLVATAIVILAKQ